MVEFLAQLDPSCYSCRMRVLVAERDPMVRRWLGQQAAQLGVEMVFCGNGGEALQAIRSAPPDCVVLDACSSAEQDLPLWTHLRQNAETQHLPLLLYSSSDRWQRVAELAGAELDGFIARPFTPAALLSAAEQASSRRTAAAQA
jgi:CheY-like chemotaxis protein